MQKPAGRNQYIKNQFINFTQCFPFDSSCFPPDGCEADIVANDPSPLMVIKKPL
jgi:hypothetical protein